MNVRNTIQGGISVTPAWFKEEYGVETRNPFTTDLDLIAETDAEKARILYQRFPDLPLGNPNPTPKYFLQEHDPRIVCATAYGASYPTWDKGVGTFWPKEDEAVWGWVKSVSDVEKIEIPDWKSNRLVQEMQQKLDEAKTKSKYEIDTEQVSGNELPWKNPHTGREYRMAMFMAFIDLGAYLLGSTNFLTMLAADHVIANALLKKSFEVSASYVDFMLEMFDNKLEGFASLGGDSSCMLSPDMYREYAMTFDELMIEKCGNLPRNLHSCGPSAHLYDVWREYKNPEQIVVMQTRGVIGEARRLRDALPNTYLMITFHPPQVDFENEDAGKIKELVWQFAEDVGFRDLQLHAFASKPCDKTDENIRAFYQALDEVNKHITGKT